MTAALVLLRRFVARAPWRFALGVLLVAVTVLSAAGLLAASGRLITGCALAGLGLIVFDTFVPSAAVRFLAITRTLARYGERLATHDATLRFLTLLRVDAFRALAGEGRAVPAATSFARLSSDLDALDGLVIRLAVPVLAGLLVLAGVAAWLSAYGAGVAALTVLPVLAGGVVAPLLAAGALTQAAQARLAAQDAARRRLIDLDRGRAELLVSGGFARLSASVGAAAAKAARAEARGQTIDAWLRFASGVGAQGAVLGALAALGPAVAAGSLDVLTAAAVTLAAFALGEAVAPLRVAVGDLGRVLAAARRLAPLAGPAPAEAAPARPDDGAPLPLRLAGDVLHPGSGRAALRGLDLTIAPGAVVALVGPSGAGKSTLLGAWAGLLQVDGVARIGEAELCVPGLTGAGHRIGWLGQRNELFRATIAENLRFAAPEADEAALAQALVDAGLFDVVAALPLGLNHPLGDGGAGLSGGERRRLCLARLMLSAPDVILLDEPTEGLDGATAAAVFDNLLTWRGARTLVFSTHRPAEAARADRILRVENGQVAADGGCGTPTFGAELVTMATR